MITITVCIGSSCHLKGSYDVVNALQRLIKVNNLEKKVSVEASFCLGNCTKGVSVKINNKGEIYSLNKDNTSQFFSDNILPKIK